MPEIDPGDQVHLLIIRKLGKNLLDIEVLELDRHDGKCNPKMPP
jgi:hypothetical protein